MNAVICRFQLTLVLLMALLGPTLFAAEQVDYARDVFPILETYCVGCHNQDDPQGGLAMDEYANLIKGGESGVAITSGVPDSSRMLLMIQGKLEPKMPPDDAEGPNESELEKLTRWVEQGAVGPEGDMPIKRTLRTPSIETAADVVVPITAIAASDDGSRTACGSFDRIEIKDHQSRSVVIESENLGKINSLAFSRDATELLVASGLTGAYGRAAIYDTRSGALVSEFLGHRDTLYAAQFSPDESIIATAGYDRSIVIWDRQSGEPTRQLNGHNGAIFDLAFSPDGSVLVSACADETVKVWNVRSGQRLDTLSQPEGEVFAVAITRDGKHIVACSGDSRIRVWRLESVDTPAINPLLATRFIDETPVINFAISPDNQSLIAIAESGAVKQLRTSDWQPVSSLDPLPESGTDLYFDPDGTRVTVSLMNGQLVSRDLPRLKPDVDQPSGQAVESVWMDLGPPKAMAETKLRESLNPATDPSLPIDIARNVTIDGLIHSPGESDLYRWSAARGEVWAIDADATNDGRLDPIVTVLDAAGNPVTRVRMQAVRDSYFTFRGKDSSQTGDFRVFNWQEMQLGQYLYAAGELTRLWMHPRGPDSGFEVYPGEGDRWTYFGTSGRTHALGEPAYIVQPLPPGATELANGLPVFDIPYENDDDPKRLAGKNSRLLFTAPADGLYSVQITDTRGEGGAEYGYKLAIRAAQPGFRPTTQSISKPLHPGIGREFRVLVDRQDGYQGPVTFEISGLPDRLVSNFPLTIEAGQRYATGVIWASADEPGWQDEIQPQLTAWATIHSRRVERDAGSPGKLTFDPTQTAVVPIIQPVQNEGSENSNWTLQVQRGQTVSARVIVQRKPGFDKEVSFGKERSGKNASQGVYVDNIGLNGLLIVADASEREFFLTADPTAVPGKRTFFLTAEIDGGLASHPITVEVTP
ncbi:hypothetical protein NHH03_07065 [Stieleria sp. TO1_6]|uniref:c-type cytochrome domain-containing protein n=1 Tax=Stieleria tagensis TaxID=2956795 RepID=UPI00209B9F69|nr:c-type cytochrome domain-containing protein [Stieleria tagensis]MCO8121491.1 hypothetical protein [Stieleria tagensis]